MRTVEEKQTPATRPTGPEKICRVHETRLFEKLIIPGRARAFFPKMAGNMNGKAKKAGRLSFDTILKREIERDAERSYAFSYPFVVGASLVFLRLIARAQNHSPYFPLTFRESIPLPSRGYVHQFKYCDTSS